MFLGDRVKRFVEKTGIWNLIKTMEEMKRSPPFFKVANFFKKTESIHKKLSIYFRNIKIYFAEGFWARILP